MRVLRIDRATGAVINAEMVTDEWAAVLAQDPDLDTVEAPDGVGIGWTRDGDTFTRPADEPDQGAVTLTPDVITALALTAKQRAILAAAQPTPEGG